MCPCYHRSAPLISFSLQNFGIIVAFGMAFVAALLAFSEYNTATASDNFVVLFKRGTKSPILEEAAASVDEEKSLSSTQQSSSGEDPKEMEKALADTPAMTDVFSWQHVQYTVNVSGGDRVLLDDVSGYVAPGKLTALMGESGAGKVRT
jgi:ATP-binding cassette subfamily G (WHITE) protein 2 (SNQ2)